MPPQNTYDFGIKSRINPGFDGYFWPKSDIFDPQTTENPLFFPWFGGKNVTFGVKNTPQNPYFLPQKRCQFRGFWAQDRVLAVFWVLTGNQRVFLALGGVKIAFFRSRRVKKEVFFGVPGTKKGGVFLSILAPKTWHLCHFWIKNSKSNTFLVSKIL